MKYISTRGKAPIVDFEDVVLAGLANDGGLYVPEYVPTFPKEQLEYLAGLSYRELALEIMMLFVGSSIPRDDMQTIVNKSYDTFSTPQITPVQMLQNGEVILELFHGPTLAFKDIALQFLGNLLNYILDKRRLSITIIGATSGDTGSAAIAGCRGSENIDLFMLHPKGKVSDVQRMQMTTILDKNIHNLAINGNFDDCQNMVKSMFLNPEFIGGRPIVAVNSINWARIMAQVVYYFYASFQLHGIEEPVSFSVPTGNFGDIYAGYIAHKMGLPIKQLIVSTNQNDILHRFFAHNDYSTKDVHPSTSPSMDIQISSNFERLLFDLHDQDSEKVVSLMNELTQSGRLSVSDEVMEKARQLFTSASCSDIQTNHIIRDIFDINGYIIDPHTATGIHGARMHDDGKTNIVTLATAHPAKFPDTVTQAIGQPPEEPKSIHDVLQKEESYHTLPNDIDAIKDYIAKHSH